MTALSHRVAIHEVAPRDGFQNEATRVDTAAKIAFVNSLSRLGFAKIEVSSFVSPSAVPQLSDASEVFAAIDRVPGVTYVALIPNVRGLERAVAARVDEVNFVASVSAAHNRANMNMSPEDSIALLRDVGTTLRGTGIALHATAATAFACPFEGEQAPVQVMRQLARYVEAGATGLTLADTIGAASPRQVAGLVDLVLREFDGIPVTLHCHDTRGLALANILTAYNHGLTRFDAAMGGIGGCPFAPGATGNASTEDVVHMFEAMGVATGVEMEALLLAGLGLPGLVGHSVPSHVLQAGPSWRSHLRDDALGRGHI